MNIKREQYLNELIVRKHNTLIKIITGIRRCGKSYLLNTIFYDHLIKSGIKEDHIIKFAFDSANDLSLINEDLIELSLNNRKTLKNLLIILIAKLKITRCIIYF